METTVKFMDTISAIVCKDIEGLACKRCASSKPFERSINALGHSIPDVKKRISTIKDALEACETLSMLLNDIDVTASRISKLMSQDDVRNESTLDSECGRLEMEIHKCMLGMGLFLKTMDSAVKIFESDVFINDIRTYLYAIRKFYYKLDD